MARIRAVIKRCLHKTREAPAQTRYGDSLLLDSERYEVLYEGNEVWLTPKEFSLLKFLIKHQGKIQSRQTLLNSILGKVPQENSRTVDVHIRRLRSKIPLLENAIITVKSKGYKIKSLSE